MGTQASSDVVSFGGG